MVISYRFNWLHYFFIILQQTNWSCIQIQLFLLLFFRFWGAAWKLLEQFLGSYSSSRMNLFTYRNQYCLRLFLYFYLLLFFIFLFVLLVKTAPTRQSPFLLTKPKICSTIMQLMCIRTASPMWLIRPIFYDAINANFRLFSGHCNDMLVKVGPLLSYDSICSHLYFILLQENRVKKNHWKVLLIGELFRNMELFHTMEKHI